jgi:hypothetical protein
MTDSESLEGRPGTCNRRGPSRRTYFLATLVLGVSCELMHVVVGQLTLGRPWHDVTLPLDAAVPFVPGFVWVYCIWFLFLFLPAAVGRDAQRLQLGLLAALGACLSGYVIFLMFPVHVSKPILGDGISERALAAVYATDTIHGGAYLPSLHVAITWIAILACLGQGLKRWSEGLAIAFATAVTASTVLIRQHVVADLATGLLWAVVWWHLARTAYPRLAGGESDPAAAWPRLVRKAVRVAGEAVVVCILLPAGAWWAAGHFAPAVHNASVERTPASMVSLSLVLLGLSVLVAWLRGAPRPARDAGLVLLFAAVAVLEGEFRRAAVGGTFLLILLLAVSVGPFGPRTTSPGAHVGAA